jgi:hypothetical protein
MAVQLIMSIRAFILLAFPQFLVDRTSRTLLFPLPDTRYGRYGAAYNMVGLRCFNEELSLLPKNPTEAKLQATSTRDESTEPT